jgi:signal transduction histidine kinase
MTAPTHTATTLAELVRKGRDSIVARWIERVRAANVGSDLDEEHIRDHVPALLERVADMLDHRAATGPAPATSELAAVHAMSRIESGYTADELVQEHVLLRETLVDFAASSGVQLASGDWSDLHRAVDGTLTNSFRAFVEARERTIRALDRMMSEAAGHSGMSAVLERILDIFVESVPAADTAAIFVREGGRLVLRGSRGFEDIGFSLGIGEGFAGKIAEQQAPGSIRDARVEESIVSEAVRAKGVRGMYGVPLVREDQIVGVAHMGTSSASAFSAVDMMLLRGLASTATALIAQAQLVERLEQEVRLREQLVAIVGHDLRTPLGAITMGAGHLAAMPALPAAAHRVSARMLRSARRMQRIIDDLLDFSRARAGKPLPVVPKMMRLDELVRDVAQELEMALPDGEIAIEAHEAIEGSWDAERLRQALSNLLENALRHGDDSPARVTLDSGTDWASICVRNGGRPIREQDLAWLFEPFRKGVGSGGLGLGLYIAHQIVLAHGGSITVESTDENTRFLVRLPR